MPIRLKAPIARNVQARGFPQFRTIAIAQLIVAIVHTIRAISQIKLTISISHLVKISIVLPIGKPNEGQDRLISAFVTFKGLAIEHDSELGQHNPANVFALPNLLLQACLGCFIANSDGETTMLPFQSKGM
jgi:hypothetical protein